MCVLVSLFHTGSCHQGAAPPGGMDCIMYLLPPCTAARCTERQLLHLPAAPAPKCRRCTRCTDGWTLALQQLRCTGRMKRAWC